ncbi:uncharacterized protein V6R79_012445 [Siganus canaliculatus]
MEPGPDGVQDPAAPHPHLQGLGSVPTFTFWSMSLGLVLTVPLCSSSVSSAGTFELNQTQSLYEAVENQTITLEWTFTIRRPLRYYQVYCEHITDVRISVVLHVEQGVQFPGSQHPHFTGRVQFDEESFREGRVRVHVSRLRIQDSGLYQCEVETEHGSSSGKCRLSVSAAANETQTLRPGPERPGPERPGPERPGPEIRGRTGLVVALGLQVLVVTAAAAGRKHCQQQQQQQQQEDHLGITE